MVYVVDKKEFDKLMEARAYAVSYLTRTHKSNVEVKERWIGKKIVKSEKGFAMRLVPLEQTIGVVGVYRGEYIWSPSMGIPHSLKKDGTLGKRA